MKQRFAIFDLDRTITTFGTFTPFLLSTRASSLSRAVLFARLLPDMLSYKLGKQTRAQLKNKMLARALKGLSREEIDDYAERFVDDAIASHLRPDAAAAIERHKSSGDVLVLATASVDFYADKFAARLGFDKCISTRTTFSDDGAGAPQLVGLNCYGQDKLEMVQAALSGASRADQHWTVYSDHHSDIALFERADAPFVVTPARKARRLAAERNFPILSW